MITTDKALDMLPFVVDMYDKLEIEIYRKEMTEKHKGKDTDKMTVGIEVFKYIFKNIGKAKAEVYGIVSIAEDKSIEEIKNQSLPKTIMAIKEIFSDRELVDFFKQAMQ
jgi:hypothetical protein